MAPAVVSQAPGIVALADFIGEAAQALNKREGRPTASLSQRTLCRSDSSLGRGSEGVLFGEPSPPAIEEALTNLAAAEKTLGANPEATFWRGVVFARAGRFDEARERIMLVYGAEKLLTPRIDA
ncbi:MAG: hypothetical protein ACXWZ1_06590 [Gaiellaceae bacterium]